MSFPPDASDHVELQQIKAPNSCVDNAEQPGPNAGTILSLTPETRRVCLTIQLKKGRTYLHPTQINRQEMDDNAMVKLHAKWFAVIAESEPFLHHLRMLLFQPVIEVGILSAIRESDLGASHGPLEVIVSDRISSTELTLAFYRPSLLHGSRPFADEHPDIMMGSNPQKAVVVALKLRKTVVLLLVGLALLVSILIGVIVGVVTHNVGNSIVTSSGIAAMLNIVLLVVFWMVK